MSYLCFYLFNMGLMIVVKSCFWFFVIVWYRLLSMWVDVRFWVSLATTRVLKSRRRFCCVDFIDFIGVIFGGSFIFDIFLLNYVFIFFLLLMFCESVFCISFFTLMIDVTTSNYVFVFILCDVVVFVLVLLWLNESIVLFMLCL